MTAPTGSVARSVSAGRSWTFLTIGVTAGLLAAGPGIIGSIDAPGKAWGPALLYLAVALLFSPPSVGALWVRRDGRHWRIVTSEKDLSNAQRGFFLGLSGVLALEAVAFCVVWLVTRIAWLITVIQRALG